MPIKTIVVNDDRRRRERRRLTLSIAGFTLEAHAIGCATVWSGDPYLEIANEEESTAPLLSSYDWFLR